MKIIDWKKVEDFVAEKNPVSVDVGILNDWWWTVRKVYQDGKWEPEDELGMRGGCFAYSDWATPGIKAHMPDGSIFEKAFFREMEGEELKQFDKICVQKRKSTLAELKAYLAQKRTAGTEKLDRGTTEF